MEKKMPEKKLQFMRRAIELARHATDSGGQNRQVYYCCLPDDADAIGFDNVTIARHLQQPLENQPIKPERIQELHDDALAAYRNSVVSISK